MRTLRTGWIKIWRGRPPGLILFAGAFLAALICAVPIIYVAGQSHLAGGERWLRLLGGRVPLLLWNTLSLTLVVTFFALLLGVLLAWLVVKSNLPGRRVWQWLLALPLVIPPYVGAVSYTIIFGPAGFLRRLIPFDIYSFWGAAFVLILFTYPYVFLICSSALKKMNQSFEEAGRAQGLNTRQIFKRITLPLLRPAAGAGAILVSLYVLSDFGAVAMLRYSTFTIRLTAMIIFPRRH